MKLLICCFAFFGLVASDVVNYDSYKGTVLTEDEYTDYVRDNTTFYCVQSVSLPCDENGWRTLDGSCNYLANPSRGAGRTPFYRMLPFSYNVTLSGYKDRLAVDGSQLELPRTIRTKLLADGQVSDEEMSQLAVMFFVHLISDLADNHDSVAYIQQITHCCSPAGLTDPFCASTPVPDDDPFLRFSDVRCLNKTTPLSYQLVGCLSNIFPPERVTTATPFLDLQAIYGDSVSTLRKARTMSGGKLVTDVDQKGRIWPPNTKGQNFCIQNQGNETRCHDVPDQGMNTLINLNLIGIWFWRNHNNIAQQLAKYNPTWDDNTLFETARDINIAMNNQIIFYELLPFIFGKSNMRASGLISSSKSFRDLYNPRAIPQISIEYAASMRWGHIVQQGYLKLMDSNGKTYKNVSSTELTVRTGYLDQENNIEGLTQGCWRQASGAVDNIVDPQLSEFGFGKLQKAADLSTSDLHKHRLLGLQPYVKYLERCRGKKYNSFESLYEVMDKQRVETLMNVYKDVRDIDLMAGLWLENPIKGGVAPPTLFCVSVNQLNRSMVTDRYWYERQNRPHAFTKEQLNQIRKASIARLLCDNGDSITHITKNPFKRVSDKNPIVSCNDIQKINFKPWKQ